MRITPWHNTLRFVSSINGTYIADVIQFKTEFFILLNHQRWTLKSISHTYNIWKNVPNIIRHKTLKKNMWCTDSISAEQLHKLISFWEQKYLTSQRKIWILGGIFSMQTAGIIKQMFSNTSKSDSSILRLDRIIATRVKLIYPYLQTEILTAIWSNFTHMFIGS